MEQQNKYESCKQFMTEMAKRRGALGAACCSQVLLLWRGLLATAAAPQPAKLPHEEAFLSILTQLLLSLGTSAA